MVRLGPQPVPELLRPYVASLVAYDVDLGGPGVHRGLPSTSLTFVLPLDAPLEVSWAADPSSRRAGWSSVSGLHAAPASIHHDGHQTGIQLALTVAGARALLGLPAAELAGELTDLEAAVPRLADLPERLLALADWEARIALVWTVLGEALRRIDPADPHAEVGEALARLTRGVGVAAVADEVGYSRRHLGGLLRAEVGLTPKEYQRVARFEQSRAHLMAAAAAGRVSLADVAARAGYADQAHLAREWVRLAGCPPSTWMAEELPFVQAVDPETGRG
ncbi:MAG TPA: helix-turn-helix transcriptional regulator [Blastococcus sp.]|nr:helix-turn-helix transcriptional regulator [Blastococcus sp.]